MDKNYREQIEYLSNQYDEIDGYDFYKYIFPNNENKGEFNKDFSKPNAIYLYEDEQDKDSDRMLRRRIMLNDTWEDDYLEYIECNPSTLCSGLAYRGRTNKIAHAQQMNAMVFDLDGVGLDELMNLFLRFGKDAIIFRTLPMPTFVVSSGSGLHVYYVFKEPLDLFPNIKLQLKKLKYKLTFRMWEYKSTSQEKAIQYQSINQGFRMVGSVNSKYDPSLPIRAFEIGKRITLDDLNPYVREEDRVDLLKPFRPSQMTREQAKESYPEWYERVVVNKDNKQKKWDIKGKTNGSDPYALYHWWMRQVDQIRGGHRYFFLMCMAIYACKCDVPKKKLKEDMYKMLVVLQGIEHKNPITEKDVISALEAYDKEYYNFKIDDIEHLTDVRIERNKRNGRKQAQHIKYMNGIKALKKQMGEEVNEGRPSKEQVVKDYLKEHPTARKVDVIRGTGLSKPTVYKYMK
jgi:hypothetical protein